MSAPVRSPRRRGAQPGNRNRLTHGLYTRAAGERRAATARIVAAMRQVNAGVVAAARQRQALNQAGYSRTKTSKIDLQISLALFKYLAELLKSAAVPDDYPFEPVAARPGRKRAGGVQSHGGEPAAAKVPVGEGL